MNKQQYTFMLGKQMLAKFDTIQETRPLTAKEEAEKDEILRTLFESVVRFGLQLARKRLAKYMKSEDAYQDVQQEMAVIFYEKLPAYDPLRSTPTTYYLRPFNQVITDYALNYSQHMTQYNAKNVSTVRAAIKYYESRGIQWDEQMLVTLTGLSAKVVKNMLKIAQNSIMANIDDMLHQASNTPTPEETFIANERTSTLARELRSLLTEDDLRFFIYKVNPEGKERTYQEVANAYGVQVREVKKRYSNIIAILNSSRDLQSYRAHRSHMEDPKVHLQPSSDGEGQAIMFSALRNIDMNQHPDVDLEVPDDMDASDDDDAEEAMVEFG